MTTVRFPGRKYNLKHHGDEMPFHPLANIFPLMGAEEIRALKDDIVANGLQEPMVTLDGLILDGRNRYLACHGAAAEMGWPDSGAEPPVKFVAYNGVDPLAFVISMNVKRRHLDESQRAMVAANLANMEVGNFSKSPKRANLQISQAQAAALLNISERSVANAVTVRDRGVPELRRAVEGGKVAVSAAEKATKLSADGQRRFAAMAEAGDIGAAGSLLKQALRAGHERDLASQIRALPNKRYGLILADPEWRFVPWSEETGSDRSAANHYATSPLEAIKKRDVPSIAADDCALALWATVPMLPQALEVMKAWGFCVGVGTRVLTADLRWVPAETLQVGDPLLSFSEYAAGKCRRYGWALVTGNGIRKLPSCRITLEDGRQLIASEDHPWLIKASTGLAGLRGSIGGGMQWCRTLDIKRTLEDPRRRIAVLLPQLAPLQLFDDSYASGFLAGAFDGEGSLSGGRRTAASGVWFSQRENIMLEAVERALSEKNFSFGRYGKGGSSALSLHVDGGKLETMRLLMLCRPPRLLANWHKRAPNWSIYNTKKARVVAVEQIGLHECSTLSTSSGTYIAEGFGAHNTYRSHCIWLKNRVGTGYWFRNVHELLLIGVKGDVPAPAQGLQWESAFDADVQGHSEKPDEAYQMLESYFPSLPRIELNATKRRDGWDLWGASAPVDLEAEASE